MCGTLKLFIPDSDRCITSGCKVKIGRFNTTVWEVSHGWYSWGGNRPVCGWYMTDINDPRNVKPLQLPDLDDIYFIEI